MSSEPYICGTFFFISLGLVRLVSLERKGRLLNLPFRFSIIFRASFLPDKFSKIKIHSSAFFEK